MNLRNRNSKLFVGFALLTLLAGLGPAVRAADSYAVSKKVVEDHVTYHVTDSSRKMDAAVVPDLGNFLYQFKVDGKDVVIPPDSFRSYLEQHWFCCGIPFLEPWANRIDRDYYYFQGNKYLLNDSLGNLLRLPDTKLVLHGLLVFDRRWKVIRSGASAAEGAFLTSRMEFYRYPDLMAQFPFAHFIDMTYRLKDGKLENTTEIHADTAMPIDFGYHPYFRPDGPREEWTVSIGARLHWLTDKELIPTGETEPADKFLPHPVEFKLQKTFIDDPFSGLVRDSHGLAHYWVKGQSEKIELIFGPEYTFGHVYAPLEHTLICLEPETAATNAFNLNHDGKFPQLPVLEPGQVFKASFWIVPTGF
jgi:aldose 1-epimerase